MTEADQAPKQSGVDVLLDARQNPLALRRKGWLEKAVSSAIDNRILVLAITTLATLGGIIALLNMPIDAVPDISNIQVTVTTNARGLAPKEVEQYITFPIELALQSMPRLSQTRSISKYALSQVTAVFDDGTDIYWARQQVGERLKTARDQMPENIEIKMALGPIATGLGEVYQFEVRGPGYSHMQLRDILDWQIIPSLKMVRGVDEVQSMGGDAKEYQVLLNPEKLYGYRITPAEVMKALARNNANAGGGYLIEQDDQVLLRAEGLLRTPDDIGNVIVKRSREGLVRVRDLGTVVIGKKLPQSIVTENGRSETVVGIVIMRKGENSKQVVDRIQSQVAKLRPSLPPNVEIVPYYVRSTLIERTIETVKHNLFVGAIFVVVVLFFFLENVRGGLIAAAAIPLSMLGAISFLTLSHTSGNLLSLGAIDFGILIDGSVVMLENIMRRLSAKTPSAADRLSIVKEAASEVAAPVLFAVLIITVVYLPVLMLTGVAGKTFQPMALTVVFGLMTALIIALFITPSMCHLFLQPRLSHRQSLLMSLILPVYVRAAYVCAKHPAVTAVSALTFFLVSLCFIPFMGTEFIPVLKEGSLVLTVNRPVSFSLQAAAKQTTLIEKVLLELPDVDKVVSRTGHSEIAFDPQGPEETDMFVVLKEPHLWKSGRTQEEVENVIARRIKDEIPGVVFSIAQPIEQRMNELVAGAKGDVAVRIYGSDLNKLAELGNRVAQILTTVQGSSELKVEQTVGLPIVTAHLNSKALASYGVDAEDALDTVAAAVDGKVVGLIFQGKPRYNLTVRFAPRSLQQPEDIGTLPVAMSSGDLVPLSQVARIERSEDSARIAHRQGDRVLTVQANVRGRDLGSFVTAAQNAIAEKMTVPTGYRIEWGGQFENLQQAQERLFVLVPIVLLLIFILLYGLFGSIRPGLLIFTNVPFALSGGLLALLARHMPISITAGVGFIALFGVAVLNGVVLVSTIRDIEKLEDIGPRQAALKAAKQRLRPVLMTALVASLGFVPMALATSVGAEVQRPLATVVIGGLITSTLLTLLVVPALYPIVCPKRRQKPALTDLQHGCSEACEQ